MPSIRVLNRSEYSRKVHRDLSNVLITSDSAKSYYNVIVMSV